MPDIRDRDIAHLEEYPPDNYYKMDKNEVRDSLFNRDRGVSAPREARDLPFDKDRYHRTPHRYTDKQPFTPTLSTPDLYLKPTTIEKEVSNVSIQSAIKDPLELELERLRSDEIRMNMELDRIKFESTRLELDVVKYSSMYETITADLDQQQPIEI